METLNDTVYNLAAINKRMIRKPKKTDFYLFAKGLYSVLDAKQVKDIEDILDRDYNKAKQIIKQAKQLTK